MDIGPVLVDRICAAVAPLLAEQDAEIERLRKDCERLDWLESNLRLLSRATSPDMGGRNWTLGRVDGRVPKDYIHERSVRAAIDAAIAAKGAI